jgi:hypothetical protein
MLETIGSICSQRRIFRKPNSSSTITLKKGMEIRFTIALFAWLISHQPTVLFSHNKSAPAINHQPNEQAVPTTFASFINSRTKDTSSNTCSERVPDQPPRESFDSRRDDFVLPNFIQDN